MSESALFTQSEIFRTLLDNIHDGVYFVDKRRKILYWNKGAEEISGFSAEEVIGRDCAENILIHVDEEGKSVCRGKCPLAATIRDGKTRQNRLYLHHKEGQRIPVHMSSSQIRDEKGEVIGGLETFYDASTVMAALEEAEELREQALLCPLTGVGNRRYAEKTLASRLEEMRREKSSLAVLFFDIDHFKSFNDKYGHDVGDLVLKMVARSLCGDMRSYDFFGRWGGEEFIAILPKLPPLEVGRAAERLRMLVENSSYELSKGKLQVTVSIGAHTCSLNDTPASAVGSADKLMYQSKQNGRNRVSMSRSK